MFHKKLNTIEKSLTEKIQFRSDEAQLFHSKMLSYIQLEANSNKKSQIVLSEMKDLLSSVNKSFIFETSINGFNHLHDAVRLPFRILKKNSGFNSSKAELISLTLIGILKEKLTPDELASLFYSPACFNKTIFSDAVVNTSVDVVKNIFNIARHAEIFKEEKWLQLMIFQDDSKKSILHYILLEKNIGMLKIYLSMLELSMSVDEPVIDETHIENLCSQVYELKKSYEVKKFPMIFYVKHTNNLEFIDELLKFFERNFFESKSVVINAFKNKLVGLKTEMILPLPQKKRCYSSTLFYTSTFQNRMGVDVLTKKRRISNL